jgi:hypothetical protein
MFFGSQVPGLPDEFVKKIYQNFAQLILGSQIEYMSFT